MEHYFKKKHHLLFTFCIFLFSLLPQVQLCCVLHVKLENWQLTQGRIKLSSNNTKMTKQRIVILGYTEFILVRQHHLLAEISY